MAIKASSQLTVIDLTDAYSVVMTNENHTWTGTTTGVSGTQSITTTIAAYQGSDQVSCVVGDMTTPTGISAVSDGKTPSPTITITATSACTEAGSFTVPITINDDITVTKTFSFSIAYTGATGATGAAGEDGVSVTSITNYYLATDASSDVSTTTSGWSTTIQTMTTTNRYLWNYEITAFSDGSTQTTVPCIIGVYGATGATGSTGVGISSVTEYYAVSASNSSAPTSWSTTVQTMTSANRYLWNYEVITYTDGSTEPTDARVIGTYGDTGDTGEAGEDAITLSITSSAGLIFKNTSIATTLTAHVYQSGSELTSTELAELGTINWYKDGGTTAVATGQTLTISAGQVTNSASYTAQLEG